MKFSTWLISLLFTIPSVVQAAIITIEYKGTVTWSVEGQRPGSSWFHQEVGDRIYGVVTIDLSQGNDRIPGSNEAEFRNNPGSHSLVKNNLTSSMLQDAGDSVWITDNHELNGNVTDKLLITDSSKYYLERGTGFETTDYDFRLSLFSGSNWFSGDRLQNIFTELTAADLIGSSGSAWVSSYGYYDGMPVDAWSDALAFDVDWVKFSYSGVPVPEPALLAPLLMGFLLIAYRRKKVRLLPGVK